MKKILTEKKAKFVMLLSIACLLSITTAKGVDIKCPAPGSINWSTSEEYTGNTTGESVAISNAKSPLRTSGTATSNIVFWYADKGPGELRCHYHVKEPFVHGKKVTPVTLVGAYKVDECSVESFGTPQTIDNNYFKCK